LILEEILGALRDQHSAIGKAIHALEQLQILRSSNTKKVALKRSANILRSLTDAHQAKPGHVNRSQKVVNFSARRMG
jgi:hypothetical protein